VQTVAIDINVWCSSRELFIQIGNTCSASAPSRESNRQGLGLRNVADRLDMVFGRGASFRAQRADIDRFEVQISLPLREFGRGAVS
jgi:LytS/YehU family sensor histidine kinase